MLSDCRVAVESKLPRQATGQFHLIRESSVAAFRADRSLMATEQPPEAEILALARRTSESRGPLADRGPGRYNDRTIPAPG